VDVGEAEVVAGVAVGERFVVEAEQMMTPVAPVGSAKAVRELESLARTSTGCDGFTTKRSWQTGPVPGMVRTVRESRTLGVRRTCTPAEVRAPDPSGTHEPPENLDNNGSARTPTRPYSVEMKTA
jgi:hypothetical protein